jgi:DNA-binding winged helix-turn-helix (wHTH) protein
MSRSYSFGEYRINPALRELWREDRLIALPPHVFDCLTYLLERHDRAVGRDELVAAVWGKTQISDTLLGQTILRIRRELGDDAKDRRALRTIPRVRLPLGWCARGSRQRRTGRGRAAAPDTARAGSRPGGAG